MGLKIFPEIYLLEKWYAYFQIFDVVVYFPRQLILSLDLTTHRAGCWKSLVFRKWQTARVCAVFSARRFWPAFCMHSLSTTGCTWEHTQGAGPAVEGSVDLTLWASRNPQVRFSQWLTGRLPVGVLNSVSRKQISFMLVFFSVSFPVSAIPPVRKVPP